MQFFFCRHLNLRIRNKLSLDFKRISTAEFPLQFKASPALWAEPMKPKKKIDPAILKAREERKRKKIEKEIRKLKKFEKQLKPISEIEIPLCLLKNKEQRKRIVNISEVVNEERTKIFKEWSRYKLQEYKLDIQMLDRILNAQQQALDELRLESEELYQAALKIDSNLIPFKFEGPSETPPLESYPSPDGEYIDISKKWV